MRRPLVPAALALAVLVGLAGAAPRTNAGPAQRPNVIVVLTDDQRLDEMRVLRKTRRLVGRWGTAFPRAIASFPLCCPSRATLLTGQYAHNHGVRDNEPPAGGAQAFDDTRTLAVALDSAGYRTGHVGKYLNGYATLNAERSGYVPPGWDHWRGITAFPHRMYGWPQLLGRRSRVWGKRRQPSHYQTDVLARQAAAFVASSLRRRTPFFLSAAVGVPHAQTNRRVRPNPEPAPRHRGALRRVRLPRVPAFDERNVADKPSFVRALPRIDRSQRRRMRALHRDRLRSLLAVDDLVARLVRVLRRDDALRETLIVFTSDNGYMRGEHRMPLGKDNVYEPAIRVPLLIRGPGMPRGARVRAPVSNVDLAATIYDATGVEPAVPQDGVSLLRVARAPADFADRELLVETRRSIALRTPDRLWAEHETGSGTEYELYDLRADPHQLRSRHDDPAYATDRLLLSQRLAALRDCAGRSGPEACP